MLWERLSSKKTIKNSRFSQKKMRNVLPQDCQLGGNFSTLGLPIADRSRHFQLQKFLGGSRLEVAAGSTVKINFPCGAWSDFFCNWFETIWFPFFFLWWPYYEVCNTHQFWTNMCFLLMSQNLRGSKDGIRGLGIHPMPWKSKHNGCINAKRMASPTDLVNPIHLLTRSMRANPRWLSPSTGGGSKAACYQARTIHNWRHANGKSTVPQLEANRVAQQPPARW